MKNKKLKEYINEINDTMMSFEEQYQETLKDKINFDDGIYSQEVHDNIITYLTALRELIYLKLKIRGEKK